jgi:hypothetical protein
LDLFLQGFKRVFELRKGVAKLREFPPEPCEFHAPAAEEEGPKGNKARVEQGNPSCLLLKTGHTCLKLVNFATLAPPLLSNTYHE